MLPPSPEPVATPPVYFQHLPPWLSRYWQPLASLYLKQKLKQDSLVRSLVIPFMPVLGLPFESKQVPWYLFVITEQKDMFDYASTLFPRIVV